MAFSVIDKSIQSNWAQYPPFKWIKQPPPETWMTFEQICEQAGVNLETHLVTTEDGYINKVFRINNGLNINSPN